MPETVREIVERHVVGFDDGLTFKQNCVDSLTMAEIVADLEDAFDVMLMSAEWDTLNTLEDLENVVS